MRLFQSRSVVTVGLSSQRAAEQELVKKYGYLIQVSASPAWPHWYPTMTIRRHTLGEWQIIRHHRDIVRPTLTPSN